MNSSTTDVSTSYFKMAKCFKRYLTSYKMVNNIKTKEKTPKNICSPPLDEGRKKNIQTVTAIKMSLTHTTIANISKNPFEVVKWEEIKYKENIKPKTIDEIFKLALFIYKNLPQSDIYVLEQLPNKLKQPNGFAFLLNLISLQSCLFALINANSPKIYTIKPDTITRHFNLGIKNERISCIDLIFKILNKKFEYANLNNLIIPLDVQSDFLLSESIERHDFGIALLLAVAFYDLNQI